MEKKNLDIEGMHCASCALLIENQLKKIRGIQQANINFSAEKATITFDEDKVNLVEIQEAIKRLGYIANQTDETIHAQTEIKKRNYLSTKKICRSISFKYTDDYIYGIWFCLLITV